MDLNGNGVGTHIKGMVITGGTTYIHASLSGNGSGDVIIIQGAIMSHGDFSIYNENGFVLLNGDDNLLEALSEGGNLNLSKWQET